MVGVVAWLQMVRLTRRGTLHVLRLRYTLLVAFELCLFLIFAREAGGDRRDQASVLFGWFHALFWQQIALVLLAGPVFAAGAITDEKASGTLEYLLITPMGDLELVLGKWLGFSLPVLVLALPGVPMQVLLGALLGLPAADLLTAVLVPLVAVPAVVAVSLLASAVVRKTPVAVSISYVASTSLVGLAWAFEYLAWLAVVVPPCLILAALLLRPISLRARRESDHASSFLWPRPPVGERPVAWREVWFGGSRAVPWWAPPVALCAVTLWAHGAILNVPRPGAASWLAEPWNHVNGMVRAAGAVCAVGLVITFLIALFAAIRGAASIAAERERRTWDEVLLTPDDTLDLLLQKHRGIVYQAAPLACTHLLVSIPMMLITGPWGAAGLLLLWLTGWPLLLSAGAVGLKSSARSGNSWHALAVALLGWWFFLTGMVFAIFLLLGFGCIPTLWLIIPLTSRTAQVVSLLIASLATWIGLVVYALFTLGEAARWIDENERVPQGAVPRSAAEGPLL